MRVLFISNFYPPARPGGYTQWCHEVAQALEARGHSVAVLTSRHERDKAPAEEMKVHRVLHLEADPVHYSILDFFTSYLRNQEQNTANLNRVIEEFQPDLVFIWGMWLMSKRIAAQAEERMSQRVVYYISDYWPTQSGPNLEYWRRPANRWFMRLPKRMLGAVAQWMLREEPELQFRHAICVSQAVKQILMREGIPVEDAVVIHGGSDLGRFQRVNEANGNRATDAPLKLLYAGQIVPHKGVHTAIEAAGTLLHEDGRRDFELNIVGAGSHEYLEGLKQRVGQLGLQDIVRFRGEVPKGEMPAILASSDVLVFPSVYEEPFARMTQEAMAAGLVVVGTPTGGTPEILRDEHTGLFFGVENARGLANQIARLSDDPKLRARLSQAGRLVVERHFTLERMVDQIEEYLFSVVSWADSAQRIPKA